MSELTLATVKPVISGPAYQQLTRMFTDKDLQELSSSEGRTLDQEHNVQMGWHTNETGEVDGIFLRMLTGDSMQVCTWLKNDTLQKPYEWTIASRYVSPPKALTIPRIFADYVHTDRIGMVAPLVVTHSSGGEVPKRLKLLPKPKATDIPPQGRPDTDAKHSPSSPGRSSPPSPTRKNYNFTKIGVSILLTSMVLYAVKKFFVKPKPPQIAPPIQSNGNGAFSKPIAT
ncbi:MAG: hypothetical protein KFB95_09285 [Simkaniaceae bacterium]|nr:MAG: hypothetical protein KFB95_09285 [Simkaniaceae bacterium]